MVPVTARRSDSPVEVLPRKKVCPQYVARSQSVQQSSDKESIKETSGTSGVVVR